MSDARQTIVVTINAEGGYSLSIDGVYAGVFRTAGDGATHHALAVLDNKRLRQRLADFAAELNAKTPDEIAPIEVRDVARRMMETANE